MTLREPTRRGSGGAVGFRLATRLARREVLRRPGRTLLVAMLVAMPVAGMLVADVLVRTEHETPLQLWRSQYGMADAVVSYTNAPPTGPSRVATLLAKSRIVAGTYYVDGRLLRTVDSRLSNLTIESLPMSDPITHGIVQMMSGRPPAGGNEVFLTRVAARQLGVRAGDTLRLARPARHSFLVTGVGEMASDWGRGEMVLPTGVQLPWKPLPFGPEAKVQLVDLPENVRPVQLTRLLASHEAARWSLQVSPALVASPPDIYTTADTARKIRWSWVVGALVLTVAGIVIAAAFAAGARRQLVTLGQLAANGAPPKTLRRVLFLQGTWTGFAGALLGLGLGAASLAALAPHIDRIFGKDLQPYTVSASDLIPIFVLGLVTATVAALLPARTTSRIPVLSAIAGRRPLGRVPRWLPITGACVATGGLALFGLAVLGANGRSSSVRAGHWQVWALTAIAGGVAVLLGACAIAPAYVSVLEPAAGRASGSGRIAMRSLARQRTRTGAVVSAIAATSALAIAASALVLSAHVKNDRAARYIRPNEVQIYGTGADNATAPPASLVAAEQKVLPHSVRFQLTVATLANTSWSIQRVVPDHTGSNPSANDIVGGDVSAAIADRSTVVEYGLSSHDREQLTAAGALLLGPLSGRVVIALITHVAPNVAAPPPREFQAALVDGRNYPLGSLPSLLLTPATARRLGMTPQASTVVLRTKNALTTDLRNQVTNVFAEALDSAAGRGLPANVNYYTPPGGVDPLLIQWVLLGIALVLVLFVVAVNLALSATETRDERDVLTIVGASPGSLRRANGFKALLLTFMGAVLAIPVGFLPVAVFTATDTRNVPLVFPWQVVAALVVALPIVAGLVTTAASGVALRVRPVRISTMAYD